MHTWLHSKISQGWHCAPSPPACRGAEILLWESYRNKDFCNLVLHINSEGMQQVCPPLHPRSSFPFSFPTPLLPDAWHCWHYPPPGLDLWEPAVGVLPFRASLRAKAEEIKDKYENNHVKVIGRESTPRAKAAWHTYHSTQSPGTWPALGAKSSCTYR